MSENRVVVEIKWSLGLNHGTVDCDGTPLKVGDVCMIPSVKDATSKWRITGSYRPGNPGDDNVWIESGIINTRLPACRLKLVRSRRESD